MGKKGTPHRRWTAADDALLAERVLDGVPRADIATELGRTLQAVHQRQYMLDLTERSDRCLHCGAPMDIASVGRPRRYCSDICRKNDL